MSKSTKLTFSALSRFSKAALSLPQKLRSDVNDSNLSSPSIHIQHDQNIRSGTKHFSMSASLDAATCGPRTLARRTEKLSVGMAGTALLALTTGFTSPTVHAANMLFKSDFGSDTMLYPAKVTYSTGGWQDFAGTDVVSGSLGPISLWDATDSGFEMIADVPVTSSTFSNYMTNQIQQVTGPNGNQVSALFQNVKISNAGPPTNGASQDAFMIKRGLVDSGDRSDTGDVYYTYWFKFQSDLHTQLSKGVSGSNWRVMSEWKTGGLNNTWRGDYRINTLVIQDSSGQLYWLTKGDNVANGGSPEQIYWQVTNTTVPVPVGEWFKYEVFWHRSSGSDGRYWAAVNGQVIADHKGPNMGIHNLPINRLMLSNAYSGGKTPIQQWLTGLEIWNGFPCGAGVSCYGNTSSSTSGSTSTDSSAPSVPTGLSATAGSSNMVNLAWNASTDNVSVAGYRISRNGTEIGTSTTSSFTDTSVVGGTSYNYTVKAYDAKGNISASSNTATVKTPLATANITSYYVGNITTTSATINWTTDLPSTGVISYGTNASNLSSTISDSNPATSHSVNITGLTRRTTYYYKITANSGAASPTSSFRTKRR